MDETPSTSSDTAPSSTAPADAAPADAGPADAAPADATPADAGPLSLTEQEARDRARLLQVDRYDIEVDLRGLLEGELWLANSTVRFRCAEADPSTFLDCVGDVESVTLNGSALDLAELAEDLVRGRIPLTGLRGGDGASANEVVVVSRQSDTGSGTAILRTVDPSDKLVYVWTSFEPDGARHAWACFDQPDLKAPHRFVVDAPQDWTVTSNGAPDSVEDADDGGRRWTFPDTPPLSTYVVVVNAGPFHEIREQRGDHSLGLYCRQSLRSFLERDAEEFFRVTEQGLAFFGERFSAPFPQERYDQVFVPNMGGAMENWGCVTWTDAVLFRSPPTYAQRQAVASVTLHEMAHMWFGDLVTMRWWDDLWLNEAFASFAASWASANATEYTDAWAAFLAGREILAYEADRSPATHPIRGSVPDVAHAFASFDDITYAKGEAVLRQLMEYVGEEAFVAGLRAYFRDHAWGNTRLADLTDAIGAAAGRDLDEWSSAWLDRQGTDTLSLIGGAPVEGGRAGATLVATSPDDGPPRSHRLRIGSYRRSEQGLELVGSTELETTGTATPQHELPDADLHLVNDGDLTFASVRTDERSLETMLSSAARLPEPTSRALVVTTAWDMLARGELSSGEVLDCVVGVLATEPSPGVVEAFFRLAVDTAERWSPTALVGRRLERVAEVAARRAEEPDLRQAALIALAASASTIEQLATLDRAAVDDVDLAWRTLARRAALGEYDEAAVQSLVDRDPDPEAHVSAWGVTAARPVEEAKAEIWEHVFRERAVPAGSPTLRLGRSFWRPEQHDLLLPWAHRYLDELGRLGSGGLLAMGSLVSAMAPSVCDADWLERAGTMTAGEDLSPRVRRQLLQTVDQLTRIQRARE